MIAATVAAALSSIAKDRLAFLLNHDGIDQTAGDDVDGNRCKDIVCGHIGIAKHVGHAQADDLRIEGKQATDSATDIAVSKFFVDRLHSVQCAEKGGSAGFIADLDDAGRMIAAGIGIHVSG